MTRYLLKPEFALRSWEDAPYAMVRTFTAEPALLSETAFRTAALCDGATDLEPSAELELLMGMGAIESCDKELDADARASEANATHSPAGLLPRQKHVAYPNLLMPWLALQITSRCNYDCLHCFNATSNKRLSDELSFSDIDHILEEAKRAGMRAVLLTGGEPLLHPEFPRIVQAIYMNGLFVHELNTNGHLLSKETLNLIASYGFKPEIKISFDGIGFHDWMRNANGAEREALRAIQLSRDAGFRTCVQMNVNRANEKSVFPTVRMLDEMGVHQTRVICTIDTPRWKLNAQKATLDWREYLELALDSVREYTREPHAMELDFWRAITLFPSSRSYCLTPVQYDTASFNLNLPLCPTVNGMPAIGANGRMYPCLQCSGTLDASGTILGNVLENDLIALVQGDAYCEFAHATIRDRLKKNGKCGKCGFLPWCAGGCPALGLHHEGDFLASDPSTCMFFKEGWVDRFEKTLAGWRNDTPLT